MGKITRRVALGIAGLAGLGIVVYGGALVACRFVPRKRPDFFALLDAVPDIPAARRIGRAVVLSGHAPSDLKDLADRIAGREHIRTALSTGCPTTRKRLVQAQCGADFSEGRMVSVDGWLLSETEADFCAAAWLARGYTA